MTHNLLNKNYIVVFDMDETLGHFEQLNIFWQGLQNYYNNKLTDRDLYNLIDVFYNFLRPNIFYILNSDYLLLIYNPILHIILFLHQP